MIIASQLVSVPWIDAKHYASIQTMDEARHVAFGVRSLRGYYDDMAEGWKREEVRTAILASEASRMMRGTLFMRVVPNIKRLGLLTPRVRRAFEALDILQFEGMDPEFQEKALGLA
jgi:hypothetical protein